jgi:transcriptional regulator with XRE-family HTH domain
MVRRHEDETDGDETQVMMPEQFRAWRKGLGLKQRDAAERLGLKKRMIQYYEKGKRDGKEVVIPKTVRLACAALARGVADFDGVTETPGAPPPAAVSGSTDA